MIANGWVPIGPSVIFNGQTAGGGPAPVSGRVTSIVVDPFNADIVYVGTATGGVWKTTDRGLGWRPIMDSQLTLTVGSLAIDPRQVANNPRVYVATGEGNEAGETLPGVGVYTYIEKPVEQWTLVGNADLKRLHVYKMLVLPGATVNDPNEILLATDGGLWQSTTDGLMWSRLQILADPGAAATDIVYNPLTSELFVALFGFGVFKRTGGGGFAALQQGGQGGLCGDAGIQRIGLAMCDTQPSKMYAVFGRKRPKGRNDNRGFHDIWATTDGGANWVRRKLPKDDGNNRYNLLLGVHPQEPNIVIFGGRQLWKSDDGGESWKQVSYPSGDSSGTHADQHAVAFSQMDPKAVWVGNDGGVWLSEDKGDSFFPRNRGLQTIQYYSIAQNPNEASIILGGAQDNGTSRYEGSPAWNLTTYGDGFFCAIDWQEPFRCYASYMYLQEGKIQAIQRSEKWGQPGSWSNIVDGISNTFPVDDFTPFYVPFVIDPKDHNVLYLGSNRLYRSENCGGDWVEVKDAMKQDAATGEHPPFSTGPKWDTTITAIAVDPVDTSVVFIGTHDGRLIKLNQDATDKNLFKLAATSPPPIPAAPPGAPPRTAFVSDLAVPPGLGKPVLVAYGSPQLTSTPIDDIPGGRILVNKGPDDARQWVSLYDANLDITVDGLPIKHSSNPVNAIAIDPTPPFKIYIGCDTGIFVREGIDPGGSWTPYSENLPNVAIGDLQFHAKARLLRAATMGRSVWERAVDKPAGGNVVDLYVRDNIVDIGRAATPATEPDPTSGQPVTPVSGADVKIDTPFLGIGSFSTPISTVDYTKNGDADYAAFAQLGSDNLRRGVTSRIHAQVINRGPDDATQVKVRAFWASQKPDGTYPALPPDFWTAFPNSDPGGTDWKPFGPAKPFAILHPAEPGVASWDYKMPGEAGDKVGILVCATCQEDPIMPPAPPIPDVAELARTEKHIALREVGVGISAAVIIIMVLVGVGLAATAIGVGTAIASKHH